MSVVSEMARSGGKDMRSQKHCVKKGFVALHDAHKALSAEWTNMGSERFEPYKRPQQWSLIHGMDETVDGAVYVLRAMAATLVKVFMAMDERLESGEA